jgi:hypothetical protein
MILIDTDHATFLKYPESERGRRFIDRLIAVPQSEVIGVSMPSFSRPTAATLSASQVYASKTGWTDPNLPSRSPPGRTKR